MVMSEPTAAAPSMLPWVLTAAKGASSAPLKFLPPKLSAVADGKFHSTRLRQVALVNWLTILPAFQVTLPPPVTLMTMVVALPGSSSICCTLPLPKSALAATEKTAMPQLSTCVTVNFAGPGWLVGRVAVLFGVAMASCNDPPCRVAVSGPALSDGSGIVMPPPL